MTARVMGAVIFSSVGDAEAWVSWEGRLSLRATITLLNVLSHCNPSTGKKYAHTSRMLFVEYRNLGGKLARDD